MFTPDSISDLSMMTREDNNEFGAVIGGHVHSGHSHCCSKGEISRLKLLVPLTGRLRCGGRLKEGRFHACCPVLRASFLGTSRRG